MMARRKPIEEEIEQWFCNAPASDVAQMLLTLRIICRARGGVEWPAPEGKRKRKARSKGTPQPQLIDLTQNVKSGTT